MCVCVYGCVQGGEKEVPDFEWKDHAAQVSNYTTQGSGVEQGSSATPQSQPASQVRSIGDLAEQPQMVLSTRNSNAPALWFFRLDCSRTRSRAHSER